MATPPNKTPVLVDAWALRCIFNKALIVANTAYGNLTMKPARPRKAPGSRHWVYLDKNGDEVATAHFKERDVLDEPDPKTVTVGDVRYVIFPEDHKKNPENRLFNTRAARELYGCYRKVRCCLFGPLAVLRVPLSEFRFVPSVSAQTEHDADQT